jgi:hypothetical protein
LKGRRSTCYSSRSCSVRIKQQSELLLSSEYYIWWMNIHGIQCIHYMMFVL